MERSLAMWALASRVQADPEVSAAAAARGGRLRQRWATRLPREPGGGAGAASQRSAATERTRLCATACRSGCSHCSAALNCIAVPGTIDLFAQVTMTARHLRVCQNLKAMSSAGVMTHPRHAAAQVRPGGGVLRGRRGAVAVGAPAARGLAVAAHRRAAGPGGAGHARRLRQHPRGSGPGGLRARAVPCADIAQHDAKGIETPALPAGWPSFCEIDGTIQSLYQCGSG